MCNFSELSVSCMLCFLRAKVHNGKKEKKKIYLKKKELYLITKTTFINTVEPRLTK